MSSVLCRLRWVTAAVWVWSWYTMFLEIVRWKHVTPALRFNATPIPGTGRTVKPGRPLKALFVCFFAAPPLFVFAVLADRVHRRTP